MNTAVRSSRGTGSGRCLRMRAERFAEIFGDALRGRFHSLFALVPVRGADFAVFLEELERVQNPQRLIDAASERKIVDEFVTHDALPVDEEESAQGDGVIEENTVVARDAFCGVRDHREADAADAALVRRNGFPGEMRVLRVG